MKLLFENWRQYLNEVFETEAETSKPPTKLSGGQNMGYTTFSVNDKKYQIRITKVGQAAARLWQVEFYREIGWRQESIELLGDSVKEVFTVLSTVFNWSLKWQLSNKAKARTIIIGGKDEGKRINIYRRMAEKTADRSGYSVKETRAIDRSGEEKTAFVLFDPNYIEKYPKYRNALNKDLKKYLNITL